MNPPTPGARRSPTLHRLCVAGAAGLVAAVDLAVKAWARAALPADGIEAGPLDLWLAFNAGVAFSIGHGAPAAAVVTATLLITMLVAGAAWQLAPRMRSAGRLGLAGVLGGAVANLADRAVHGVVTDYLHTGWWPTFNLADVAICTGAGLLVLSSLRPDQQPTAIAPHPLPREGGSPPAVTALPLTPGTGAGPTGGAGGR